MGQDKQLHSGHLQTLKIYHERRGDWDCRRETTVSVIRYMARTKELVLPVVNNKPDTDRGSIFFVGTATVILRYSGFTILTDPNFLHPAEPPHLCHEVPTIPRTDPA